MEVITDTEEYNLSRLELEVLLQEIAMGGIPITYEDAQSILIQNSTSYDYEGGELRGIIDQSFWIFENVSNQLRGRDYWRLLSECYTMMKTTIHNKRGIREAFQSDEPDQEYYMSEGDREFFNNLPDEVAIYRGMSIEESQNKDYGVSWTLSKDVAEKFTTFEPEYISGKTDKEKVVVSLTVPKDAVIAYCNEREEQEIIYLHSGCIHSG